MNVHLTARHCKLNDEEQQAARNAAEHFGKFHDGIVCVNGVFDDGSEKTCEYTVHVNGHTIVAREHADTFGKAIHDASHKVVRQLRKLKTKLHFPRQTIRA